MTNNHDIFISYKRKSQNDVIHGSLQSKAAEPSAFGTPLVLPRLSYRSLKWIRSAFEESSMVMQRSMLLTDISAFAYETGLVAPRTHVLEAMNIGTT